MKTFLTIVLTLFIGLNIGATEQLPDKIIYQGKTYNLHNNPLETYFKKHPNKRPAKMMQISNLWRGYVATFEFKDNQLFLKDIEIQYRDTTSKEIYTYKWKSVLHKVIPDGKNIKIDWLTGLLVIPHGKLIEHVHMGYSSTYENYILLELENGHLKKEKHFDRNAYEAFKDQQFQVFKQTDDFKKHKTSLLKKGHTDETSETLIKNLITTYTEKILTD